jgi:hypothetical protein
MHERRYICACMSYLKVQGQPSLVKFDNFHIHESIKRLRLGSKVRVAAVAGRRHDEHRANWEYVHRLLAHASAGYCERTVEKAKGLPRFLEKPSKPCPECALGKMKAPRRGQGELSTGLPEAIKPGQQFNSDIFGPFAVPGVKGEKYFITLSCTYSGWGTVRTMVTKDQASSMLESMINEARSVSMLSGNTDVVIHTPVLHTDNDSVFRSKECTDRLRTARVHLHYVAAYEPRTNPYSERY